MKTSETAVVDTNVILYAVDQDSPFYSSAKPLCERGLAGEISLCIKSRIVSEFLATATNPKRFRHPISIQDAGAEIVWFIRSPYIYNIFQTSSVYEKVIELVECHQISKQEVHDVLLAATMLTNGITHIYTYNHKDFKLYREITVLTP